MKKIKPPISQGSDWRNRQEKKNGEVTYATITAILSTVILLMAIGLLVAVWKMK